MAYEDQTQGTTKSRKEESNDDHLAALADTDLGEMSVTEVCQVIAAIHTAGGSR